MVYCLKTSPVFSYVIIVLNAVASFPGLCVDVNLHLGSGGVTYAAKCCCWSVRQQSLDLHNFCRLASACTEEQFLRQVRVFCVSIFEQITRKQGLGKPSVRLEVVKTHPL